MSVSVKKTSATACINRRRCVDLLRRRRPGVFSLESTCLGSWCLGRGSERCKVTSFETWMLEIQNRPGWLKECRLGDRSCEFLDLVFDVVCFGSYNLDLKRVCKVHTPCKARVDCQCSCCMWEQLAFFDKG